MKKFFIVIIALIVLATDQAIKFFLVQKSLVIINENIILGLINCDTIIFISVMLLLLILIVTKINKRFTSGLLPCILILIGAVSNMIDRLIRSGVIDYFKINLFGFNINFNLSDIYILLGAIIYAASIFKKNHN
jgi:lipoprotein signal peptidase